ncbi:MAG: hypothetical protein J6E46_06300 [Faecalicoccus sp.]|nr:hypothetical protein [Faecalicoccus sp.]
MKQFTIPMAMADFIPVILFALSMMIVFKDLNKRMNTLTKGLFGLGSILVTLAGCLKASYKLLYALGIGDFIWMNNQFFANQAIGFVLAGVGLTMLVSKGTKTYGLIPTMALVGLMVVGLGAMDASLAYIANQLKQKKAMVLIIVSFFFSMAMGYLSSKNFDGAFMNWIAQGINIAGQACLYVGCSLLHKAGLKNW